MARLRKGPASQPATMQAQPSTRRALKEKTNTAHPPAPSYDNDGDMEGLVKDAKPGRGRGRPRKVQQDSDELVMAGGLANSDEASAPAPAPAHATSEPVTTTDELAKSDAEPRTQPKVNKRPARTVRKVVQSQAQSKVLEGLKQRMEATARGQRGKATTSTAASDPVAVSSKPPQLSNVHTIEAAEDAAEGSGLTLSPSPPRQGRLSAARLNRTSMIPPGSALKIQGTPAVESSLLALKNFKRRPRQMSMLSMVQQRTASARPSTAHDSMAVDGSSAFDFDLDGGEEDDFAPDAEGTPLNAEKARRRSAAIDKRRRNDEANPTQASRGMNSAKKRKSMEADHVFAAQGSSSSKRRKSTATVLSHEDAFPSSPGDTIQVRPHITNRVGERSSYDRLSSSASSGPRSVANSPVHDLTEANVDQRDDDDVEIPSTEPAGRRAERAASVELVEESDIDVPNGTMAEPASSSPAPNNAPLNQDLADPPTQFSPAASRPVRAKKQKPISTATLQSLLPKRRKPLKPRQKKTEYDMESESSEEEIVLDASHLEDDEDELGGGLRKSTKSAPSKARKSKAAKKISKTSTKPTNRGKRKASVVTTAASGASKTYARATASDKENDGYDFFEEADESTLPEVSISTQELAQSRELEEAKRKFAEVDDWDMDFESMSQDEHRRSSQSWR